MNQLLARSELSDLAEKVIAGERLSLEDGLRLYEAKDLLALGARVALMCRRAATTSANGTIVPRTIIQTISDQVGRWLEARLPRSDTSAPTRSPGKFHHGARSDQKSVAKRNPQAESEIGSRLRTPRSASRMYAA